MSSPSAENGYQVPPNFVLNRIVWNAVFLSINQRLEAREALEASFEALITEGTALSIQAIQDNLGPQLAAIAAQIDALAALIVAAEDAVAEIISGNLPAGNVVFTPAAGIAATTVQTALEELAGDIASLTTATNAALATKPSLGLVIALGG
jgi:hypothetical protein